LTVFQSHNLHSLSGGELDEASTCLQPSARRKHAPDVEDLRDKEGSLTGVVIYVVPYHL
jgi:hypothetical protein